MPLIVTLLSDFGSASPYPAAMKAVLARRSGATLIDISHDVPRHDVQAGAFLLYSAAPNFLAGTVHLAVVDPGVGTTRRPLIVVSGGQTFVGPDNGLLIPAARRLGTPTAFEISDAAILGEGISSTFHGRDVFAPAAAVLTQGTPPSTIALPVADVVNLDFGTGRRINDGLAGHVIYVDAFGNLVTNIPNALLEGYRGPVEIRVGRRRGTGQVVRTYGDVKQTRIAVLAGSDGWVEIAIREGHAATRFGAAAGTSVAVAPRVTRR
ncbi:MAG TPA: SAM-dependent chlorinase/fluorinase [bacterium]